VSPREKIPPSEASRLNVFSLFSGDSPPPLLYEITAKTIATLYQGAPFFRPKLEYQLLDALIQKKSPDSFTDLFPEAPGLREIFYKMLKGTNFYSLRPKKGYPPLTDFLTLNAEKKETPLSFPYASRPLLTILFDEKIAQAIIDAEKIKWDKDHKHHPLSEAELETLLFQNSKNSPRTASLRELLNFSLKRPPLNYRTDRDEVSKITLRRKVL
jgi:hypothetical protein